MKTKHTRKYPDLYIAEIASEDDEDRIVSDPEQMANARLIAAAPDLLQAAKEVIAAWERGDLAAAVRGLACTVKEAES